MQETKNRTASEDLPFCTRLSVLWALESHVLWDVTSLSIDKWTLASVRSSLLPAFIFLLLWLARRWRQHSRPKRRYGCHITDIFNPHMPFCCWIACRVALRGVFQTWRFLSSRIWCCVSGCSDLVILTQREVFFYGSAVKRRWVETSRSDYPLMQHLISESPNIPLWMPHSSP